MIFRAKVGQAAEAERAAGRERRASSIRGGCLGLHSSGRMGGRVEAVRSRERYLTPLARRAEVLPRNETG